MTNILSFSNYYPFGMQMPGRNGTISGGEYRYGFNGMEKDDEVSGEGNSYDFGARMYNNRIGRFLSNDPKTSSFPNLSPYSFAENNPIFYIDENGESAEPVIKGNKIIVSANIIMYGGSASSELAVTTAKNIQKAWNKSRGKVVINGKKYKVKFKITGEYFEGSDTELAKQAKNNKDIKNNYIRVESNKDSNEETGAFIEGHTFNEETGELEERAVPGNHGFFILEDLGKKGKMSEVHEFGHMIGWFDKTQENNEGSQGGLHDTNGGTNEMAPSNTVPDPLKRKVSKGDIIKTIGRVIFKGKKGKIGKTDNKIVKSDGKYVR